MITSSSERLSSLPLQNAHSVALACLWRSRDLPLCLTEASWLPTKVQNPSYGPSTARGPRLCYRTAPPL
ncbi:hypothetical protein CgunFtcFv8_003388 [Champsocephalus gunnari]|uniref:Uncharacterized protein n=1 Tax=Champsocephalus gunnari TaxID=52237 RepID=A0AAN8DIS4_CHAGU|nr:hypothetical protein CgunFtcFv8_003388 [Champsocephalus gunnari]